MDKGVHQHVHVDGWRLRAVSPSLQQGHHQAYVFSSPLVSHHNATRAAFPSANAACRPGGMFVL